MELLVQNNNFDCGICSLMMLLNHYKIKGVEKEDLYKNAYIEKDGVSILELETLAHKFGIFLDSYEATFDEVINDKTLNNPFILVTRENDNLHYIVGVKKDNYIKLYDPKGVVKKVTAETPIENYVDILIKSEKLPDGLKYKPISKNKKLNFVNINYIVLNVFINLMLMGINFITSFVVSQMLNKIGLLDLFTLLAICFGLIIFYVINSLLEFVIFRLMFKKLNKMYLMNLNHLMNAYNFKLPGFYKTIDRNIFNNGHSILKNNIFFVNDFICDCIISTLFITVSLIIIFMINAQFLLFVFINIFVVLLISFFDHKYTNELTKISIDKNNKIQDLVIQINQFNLSSFSYKLNNLIFHKLKTNIKSSEYSTYKINQKKVWIDIAKSLWSSIFYLFVITYYVFINKANNIGTLFFCLQVISTLNKYTLELIDSVSNWIHFKIIKEMLINLYDVNNLAKSENNENLNLTKQTPILIHKTNFDFNYDIKNEKFKIDNLQISKINHFNDSVHYLKCDSLTELVLELTKKELVFKNHEIQTLFNDYIRQKLVFEDAKYTQLDYLVIYLFYLLTQENQIVILDSELEIKHSHKYYKLFEKLLNENKDNNMLILINSLIIDNLEHTVLDLNDEEDI